MIHFLKHEWKSLAWVIVLAILMAALDYHGWLSGPEGRITDWLLRARDSGQKGSPVLLLVEIDDTAYDVCFDSVSPMYAKRVVKLVEGAASVNPWVIGIDIMTAARIRGQEYRDALPGLLKQRPKLVWIAGIEKSQFELASFPKWLFGKEDELIVKPTSVLGRDAGELREHRDILWGVPVFPPDQDSGLRRFPRHVKLAADPENASAYAWARTWAGRVAEEYCLSGQKCKDESADEVLLSYNMDKPAEFAMLDLFDCDGNPRKDSASWPAFEHDAPGRIVLIGGTFSESGDFHQTPLGRRTTGLLVNAYAIQAEIGAKGIHEAVRPFALAFDLLIGFVIVLLGPMRKRIAPSLPETRWIIGGSFAMILFAMVTTLLIFGRGYLISFLGVAIGVILHQIVEIWNLDSHPATHH